MDLDNEDKQKWIALLSQVKFFSEFNNDDLKRVLLAGRVGRYNLHEYIFQEGEQGKSLFVVLKGRVKVLKTYGGIKKKEVGAIPAGECFGEMGLVLNETRTASVLAGEESFILNISGEALESMPESTQIKLLRKLAEDLAKKLKSTTETMLNPNL